MSLEGREPMEWAVLGGPVASCWRMHPTHVDSQAGNQGIKCPDLTLFLLHFLLGIAIAEPNWEPEAHSSNLAKEFGDKQHKKLTSTFPSCVLKIREELTHTPHTSGVPISKVCNYQWWKTSYSGFKHRGVDFYTIAGSLEVGNHWHSVAQ